MSRDGSRVGAQRGERVPSLAGEGFGVGRTRERPTRAAKPLVGALGRLAVPNRGTRDDRTGREEQQQILRTAYPMNEGSFMGPQTRGFSG